MQVWFLCGWQVNLYEPLVVTQAISEHFRDEGLIIKHYINSSVYFYFKCASKGNCNNNDINKA